MICIDTMVLIWGLQKTASEGQQAMIERTQRWLRSLPANERIMVPSVVVSEYLTKFTGPAKAKQLAALERGFFIPSLDVASAALAAELRVKGKALTTALSREVIKSDCYILAIAIVHGATAVVTENRSDFEKLAAGRIKIQSVPQIPEQIHLLDEHAAPAAQK